MLYRIGTMREVSKMETILPERVYSELVRDIAILDCEYGEGRDYLQEGGYSVVVETAEDVQQLRGIVDYDTHPCEWATHVCKDSDFIAALYLSNDDFAIMVFVPHDVAPQAILKDLED